MVLNWICGTGTGDDLRPRLSLEDAPGSSDWGLAWKLEVHQGIYYLGQGSQTDGSWTGPIGYYLPARLCLYSLLSQATGLTIHTVTIPARPIPGYPIILEEGNPNIYTWMLVPSLVQQSSIQFRAEGKGVVGYLPQPYPILPSESASLGLQVQTCSTGPWMLLHTATSCYYNRVALASADASAYSGLTVNIRYVVDRSYTLEYGIADDPWSAAQPAISTLQLICRSLATNLFIALESDEPGELWHHGRGLISNTSFESDLAGWSLTAIGGTVQWASGSPTGAWRGTGYALVTGPTAVGDGLQTLVSLTTGGRYTLAAHLWCASTTGEVQVQYGPNRAIWRPTRPGWQTIELPFLANASQATIGFWVGQAGTQFGLDEVSVGPEWRARTRPYQWINWPIDPSKAPRLEQGLIALAMPGLATAGPPVRIDLMLYPGMPLLGVHESERLGPETPECQLLVRLTDPYGNPVSSYTLATVTWNGTALSPYYPAPASRGSDARGELRYRIVPTGSGPVTIEAVAGTLASAQLATWCISLATNELAGRWLHKGWKVFLSLEPRPRPEGQSGIRYRAEAQVVDAVGYPVTNCTITSYEPIQPWVTFELENGRMLAADGPIWLEATGQGIRSYARSQLTGGSSDPLACGLASCLFELEPGQTGLIRAWVHSQATSPITLGWSSEWLQIQTEPALGASQLA